MLPLARKKFTLYQTTSATRQNTSIQQWQSAKLNDKTNDTPTLGNLLNNWPKLVGPFKNGVYTCFVCIYVWNVILHNFRYT